jgi:exodeoxyribonuclease-3
VRLVTWNINSLKLRLPRVQEWLAAQRPDILALQETKVQDADFPRLELEAAGYHVVYAGQRSYNGVAVLSRWPVTHVVTALPGFTDPQMRVLAVTIGGLRLVSLYAPNGQAVGSEKYAYKLQWLEAATALLRAEYVEHPLRAIVGDFNIAPEDRDVHDPDLWRGQIMCSEEERAVFRAWQGLGLQDAYRLFDQPEKTFSWWDYRQLSFPKNAGLRIDHILLSQELAPLCTSCRIDRQARKGQKPSDHAPVMAELTFDMGAPAPP